MAPLERVEKGVVLPTVSPKDTNKIDWADVAARARAELGDEPVQDFSHRLRTAMKVIEDPARPGDTLRARFGELRPST